MDRKINMSGRGGRPSPFKTATASKSHIRNIHPDFLEEKGPAREVPIVEEDSAILLNRLGVSIPT